MGRYLDPSKLISHAFFSLFLLSGSAVAQKTITLAEAQQLALTHNKKLRSAQYNIQAASAAREGLDGANKPMVDGSVMGFYVGKPLSSLLPEYGVSPSVIVKQSIYAGGKIKLGKQAAEKGVEIYQEQKAVTESEVLFNVQKAYWQVASLNEKITLAATFKAMLESLLVQLTNSFDAGMIYKNDILRVKVQLNEAELNLGKANDGLVMSKLNLAQTMGISNDADLVIADSVAGKFESLNPDNSLTAAENRAEIRMLERTLEAQQLQEKLLKAEFKPTVGLLASGFASFGPKMNFENGNNVLSSYLGAVSVNIPIWGWGQKASKIKQQSFKINAQQVEIQQARELINLEAKHAFLTLNQAARKVGFSNASVQQADENLRLSNDRFAAGTVTGQDVLEAQTLWQQAFSNVIDAKVEYKISEAAYKKALGNLD